MSVLLLVAALGATVAAFGLRCSGWSRWATVGGAIMLAPAIGLGLLSLGFFFSIFALGSPPGRWSLVGAMTLLTLLLLLTARSTQAARIEPEREEEGRSRSWARLTPALLVALVAALIPLSLLVSTLPAAAASAPFGSWDAWAIWTSRSFLIFRAEGDVGELLSWIRHSHPDYPLFLPAALAGQYALLGGESLWVPRVTSLAFPVAAGLALALLVSRRSTPTLGLLAASLFWSTPVTWHRAFTQCADLPVAYFLLLAAFGVGDLFETDPGRRIPPALGGFCLGLLAWTKNEGLVLVLVLVAGACLAGLRRERRAGLWSRAGWFGLGALPPLAALTLFKVFWSPQNETALFLADAGGKLRSWERWERVGSAVLSELNPVAGIQVWGLLWVTLLVCGSIFLWRGGRKAHPSGSFLILVVLGTWSLVVVVYVCSPFSLDWHLETSLQRLMLQLTPLTLAWIFSLPTAEPVTVAR